jgi:hypothetical protein
MENVSAPELQPIGPQQTKFLEALESGLYLQGKGELHVLQESGIMGHCCLGVADIVCDLKETEQTTLHNTYEKLGLYSRSGDPSYGRESIKPSRKYYMLTEYNDGAFGLPARTHKEIAALIRKDPSIYFKEIR